MLITAAGFLKYTHLQMGSTAPAFKRDAALAQNFPEAVHALACYACALRHAAQPVRGMHSTIVSQVLSLDRNQKNYLWSTVSYSIESTGEFQRMLDPSVGWPGKSYDLPSPLRTVRASFPAYGSSICQHISRPPCWCSSWTAPAVDKSSDNVSGRGITAHRDYWCVVRGKVDVERRLANRAPTLLLFKQLDAVEASGFPHQSP